MAVGSVAVRGGPARSERSDDAVQTALLDGVSRTFALTIPQLPADLRPVIANAYLLCRIVDTIEDEPALSAPEKRRFAERFVAVVTGAAHAEPFAQELAPRLSASTIPAEHQLIRATPAVIRITRALPVPAREAMERCVRVMADGMISFQEHAGTAGLADLAALDRYCYVVAGVVGEMLTTLFCQHSPAIARRGAALHALARSFGEGLQLTNILKDLWDDRQRGACWLPRDICAAAGVDLGALVPGGAGQGDFAAALGRLIGIAHAHLRNALAYVLLVPRRERGIRTFCLWAIGLAMLTLRNLNRRRDFADGAEVKVSRRGVRATIAVTALAQSSDALLRFAFALLGWGLPRAAQQVTGV
ncbi:MAG TPA: phytoene/squalene synthase family protein [Gemmatimonadales bacterium]|nr:phytoene/squalene synthase family protein [Gemmatimonadales bacterium]